MAAIIGLPNDCWNRIIHMLDFTSLLAARQVCTVWNGLVASEPLYSGFMQEKRKLEQLFHSTVRLSPWIEPITNRSYDLQLSATLTYTGSDCVGFLVTGLIHDPSTFISSAQSKIPFTEEDVVIASYGNTVFSIPLCLSPDRIGGHWKIKAIHLTEPAKSCTFSLLNNLPETKDNIRLYGIENIIALSETQIAVFTEGHIRFWDLLPKTPTCTKIILFAVNTFFRQAGHLLILKNEVFDLIQQLGYPHLFNLNISNLKTFKAEFCHYSEEGKIEWFQIKEAGGLEKRWSLDPYSLITYEGEKPKLLVSIHQINTHFVLVMLKSEASSTLAALNTNGKLVQQFPLLDENKQSLFLLFENILTFKSGNKRELEFWHLPSQRQLKVCDLTPIIHQKPQALWPESIDTFTLEEDRLTVLVSSLPLLGQMPRKSFRVIQFEVEKKS